MINIDEENLRNVIKRNDKNIIKRRFPIETLLSLLVYLISVLMADFTDKIYVKIVAYSVLFLYAGYFIYKIIMFVRTSFSSDKLFDEIMGVVEKEHAFSLYIIKSEDRYLLKYDKRWNCYLFPYSRTKIENDAENVKSNVFRLTGLNVEPYKVVNREDKKYSFSDQYEKNYKHTYYGFNIEVGKSALPLKQDSFTVEKTKYKWFSPEELERDKKIKTRNGTIVKFVEQTF